MCVEFKDLRDHGELVGVLLRHSVRHTHRDGAQWGAFWSQFFWTVVKGFSTLVGPKVVGEYHLNVPSINLDWFDFYLITFILTFMYCQCLLWLTWILPLHSSPFKVTAWRDIMALPEDPAKVTLDSWGIKRLFSHVLRRWLAGSSLPRASWLGWMGKCFHILGRL